jgi:hypothetical protein
MSYLGRLLKEPKWVDAFRRERKEGGKTTVTAPDGYLFKRGRGTMLIRQRADAEIIAGALRVELKRCGWPTNKVKVRLFRLTEHAPAVFYANIGVRRGLDPDLVFKALQTLPRHCGVRRVCALLDKIPERVAPE